VASTEFRPKLEERADLQEDLEYGTPNSTKKVFQLVNIDQMIDNLYIDPIKRKNSHISINSMMENEGRKDLKKEQQKQKDNEWNKEEINRKDTSQTEDMLSS